MVSAGGTQVRMEEPRLWWFQGKSGEVDATTTRVTYIQGDLGWRNGSAVATKGDGRTNLSVILLSRAPSPCELDGETRRMLVSCGQKRERKRRRREQRKMDEGEAGRGRAAAVASRSCGWARRPPAATAVPPRHQTAGKATYRKIPPAQASSANRSCSDHPSPLPRPLLPQLTINCLSFPHPATQTRTQPLPRCRQSSLVRQLLVS